MQMLMNRKVGHLAPRHKNAGIRTSCQHCRNRLIVAVAASSSSTSSSASFKLFRPPGATPQPSSPSLVHIPGADGTGVSLGRQARLLSEAGFDVWSSAFDLGGSGKSEGDPWAPLVAAADAAFRAAFEEEDEESRRPVIVAESFGASLALRLASRKPQSFSALVLINSATALSSSSPSYSASASASSSSRGPSRSLSSTLVGVAAATGIARFLPVPVYRGAAAILTPLLLDARAEEQRSGEEGSDSNSSALNAAAKMMSLGGGGVDKNTTNGVAKRLELLSRADPGAAALRKVTTKTLLVASARDALLPSVSEAGRLCRILPNARRLVLPDSGHAALLEGRLDLAKELEVAGFGSAQAAEEEASSSSSPSPPSSSSSQTPWSLSDPEFDGALESLRPLRELVSPLITGGSFWRR